MAMALTYNLNRAENAQAEAPAAFMPYHDTLAEDISADELESKLRGLVPKFTATRIDTGSN